jgi:hypothetical protein
MAVARFVFFDNVLVNITSQQRFFISIDYWRVMTMNE